MTMNGDLEAQYSAYRAGRTALADLLKVLPGDATRDFELYLTRLIEEAPQVANELEAILDTSRDLEDGVVYPAFYGLAIYYRRMKEPSKLEKLVHRYENRFGSMPMYNHLLALCLKSKGGPANLEEAVTRAGIAAAKVTDNAGVLHNYAETIATAVDEEVVTDHAYVEEAVRNVKAAIGLAPRYAKYYCTYGRLLSLRGEYAAAVRLIRKAIDIEDSRKADYPIRIGDYQYYLAKVNFLSYAQKLADRINGYEQQVEKTQQEVRELSQKAFLRNLEFLGFFAALVSFTIGSIQILGQQPFDQAAQLMVVLSGSLLCAFAGLSLLLHGGRQLWLTLAVFALGVALVGSILFLLPILSTR
jgi:tetratricopeptide (TPR) repeat protein